MRKSNSKEPVDTHGAHIEMQVSEFILQIAKLVEKIVTESVLRWCKKYLSGKSSRQSAPSELVSPTISEEVLWLHEPGASMSLYWIIQCRICGVASLWFFYWITSHPDIMIVFWQYNLINKRPHYGMSACPLILMCVDVILVAIIVNKSLLTLATACHCHCDLEYLSIRQRLSGMHIL